MTRGGRRCLVGGSWWTSGSPPAAPRWRACSQSPDAAAVPWAAFAVRLGLSELGGAARGGQRQQQRETKGDPLVGWLRREIDAARKALRSNPSQGVYQKATLEYLDSVGDLLRY
jgi:hypothetical protein